MNLNHNRALKHCVWKIGPSDVILNNTFVITSLKNYKLWSDILVRVIHMFLFCDSFTLCHVCFFKCVYIGTSLRKQWLQSARANLHFKCPQEDQSGSASLVMWPDSSVTGEYLRKQNCLLGTSRLTVLLIHLSTRAAQTSVFFVSF